MNSSSARSDRVSGNPRLPCRGPGRQRLGDARLGTELAVDGEQHRRAGLDRVGDVADSFLRHGLTDLPALNPIMNTLARPPRLSEAASGSAGVRPGWRRSWP